MIATHTRPACILFSALCLVSAATALAQSQPRETYVDEAVGNIDPLGVSARQLNQAVGEDLNTDRILRIDGGTRHMGMGGNSIHNGSFYTYRAPGLRASFDRPDYLTRNIDGQLALNHAPGSDGDFVRLVPPNTVFDLSNPTDNPIPLPTPSYLPPAVVGISGTAQLDTRINNFIDPASRAVSYTGNTPIPYSTPRPVAAAPVTGPVQLQPWMQSGRMPAPQLSTPTSWRHSESSRSLRSNLPTTREDSFLEPGNPWGTTGTYRAPASTQTGNNPFLDPANHIPDLPR